MNLNLNFQEGFQTKKKRPSEGLWIFSGTTLFLEMTLMIISTCKQSWKTEGLTNSFAFLNSVAVCGG